MSAEMRGLGSVASWWSWAKFAGRNSLPAICQIKLLLSLLLFFDVFSSPRWCQTRCPTEREWWTTKWPRRPSPSSRFAYCHHCPRDSPSPGNSSAKRLKNESFPGQEKEWDLSWNGVRGGRKEGLSSLLSPMNAVCVCTKIIDKAGGQIVASGENVLCLEHETLLFQIPNKRMGGKT